MWRERGEDGKPRDDIELPFHSSYGTSGWRDARHVGYKMKFPLLDAYPREHKIEVHRGGWNKGSRGTKPLTTKRIDGNKFIIV